MSRATRFIVFAVMLSGLLFACEGRDYRKAEQEHTIEAYREFLEAHPEGRYSNMARSRLQRLEFRRVRNQRTIEAYQGFLEEFPRGEMAKEIELYLDRLLKSRAVNLPLEKLKQARVRVSTSEGSFTIRFLPEQAPNHARNLIYLTASGFYDGIRIFDAEPGRLLLIGNFHGGSRDGPGYTIPAEINELKHVRGRVSMWHLKDLPDTAGCQFFIVLSDQPELDGRYTVFGEIESGLEAVELIAEAVSESRRDPESPPVFVKRFRLEGVSLADDRKESDPD